MLQVCAVLYSSSIDGRGCFHEHLVMLKSNINTVQGRPLCFFFVCLFFSYTLPFYSLNFSKIFASNHLVSSKYHSRKSVSLFSSSRLAFWLCAVSESWQHANKSEFWEHANQHLSFLCFYQKNCEIRSYWKTLKDVYNMKNERGMNWLQDKFSNWIMQTSFIYLLL